MRKRAQKRFKTTFEEPKHIAEKKKTDIVKKPTRPQKNYWIAITLIGAFLIVLFMNSYFNITSDVAINEDGEGLDKYYLSGPDPYYNRRLVEETVETGVYPYYSEPDPILNYPHGSLGARAPLFNMMAIGFSNFLKPFMDEVDALGRAMQFVPALFGALLVFPVYFIGKELFNRKAGLISAVLIAIIPIHLGSGHGSAYSLFDHDSFNLLLFFLTFMFLIFSLKEKNLKKSIIYAALGGVPLAALTMTWVEAQYLYVIIAVYAIIQIFIDIFTNKIELKVFSTNAIILFSGYLISLPVMAARPEGIVLDTPLLLCLGVTGFGLIYYFFKKSRIPWTISLPAIFGLAGAGLVFLYLVNIYADTIKFLSPLSRFSSIIFESGIYGNKVSQTIAEANTYQISQTVMSFGPALYWLAWAGFVLLIWKYLVGSNETGASAPNRRREYLFMITLFILNLWLSGVAGRFLNDSVPIIAILSGWIILLVVEKIDYKQMIRSIKSAGGGLSGLRKGIKFMHIIGILLLAFIVIFPNVFVSFDAAVPSAQIQAKDDETGELLYNEDGDPIYTNLKYEMFGETHTAAFGLGVGKESYWSDAFTWLSQQDTDIKNDVDKPAFISWWDYGFYCAALADHPTVADNFQDGIPPAANFHTATSEQEAVVILAIRLIEGNRDKNGGKITPEVENAIAKYAGEESAQKVVNWIEKSIDSPSYGNPIGEEYDEEISKDYPVGQQWPDNAYYHDIAELLVYNETTKISDEKITMIYHEIQEITGTSIRYYGVEGYDRQIFNIFAFLSDKSLLLVGGSEDDFFEMFYTGYRVDSQGNILQENVRWSAKELIEMSDEEKRFIRVTNTNPQKKDAYFDTMFYKTYVGPVVEQESGKQEWSYINLPCSEMVHWYGEFISKFPYYDTSQSAVIIAKYYEGARVNGTILFNNESVNDIDIIVQKNLSYPILQDTPEIPIQHDKKSISMTDPVNETSDFSLIVGADAQIIIRRYPELVDSGFVLKTIDFNSNTDPLYAPITDDVAMRKTDDWRRELGNISIEPGNIEGLVYRDFDNDSAFNNSDEGIFEASVNLFSVGSFDQEVFAQQQRLVPNNDDTSYVTTKITDENGAYNFTDLLPGYYVIDTYLLYKDGDNEIPYLIGNSLVEISSGVNYVNISHPQNSSVKGTVYYDENENDELDDGEELNDVEVSLYYQKLRENDEDKLVRTITSSDGTFEFTDKVVGGYKIIATKGDLYEAEVEIVLRENSSYTVNVSMGLQSVTVSGTVQSGDVKISNAQILFESDETVEDNTASELIDAETDENGEYTVELQPGNYNVSITKYDEINTEVLVYSIEGQKLSVDPGLGNKTGVNYNVIKRSVTVSGDILTNNYDRNITIDFNKDPDVDNNTAVEITLTNVKNDYTVELVPGSYVFSITSDQFELAGQNYTYELKESIKRTVLEGNIAAGITQDLEIKAKEEI